MDQAFLVRQVDLRIDAFNHFVILFLREREGREKETENTVWLRAWTLVLDLC